VVAVARSSKQPISETLWAVLLPVGVFAIIAAVWEYIGRRLDNLIFPTFAETIGSLVDMVSSSELWVALLRSNEAMVIGYVLAAVVGVPFGILIARSRVLGRIADPYLDMGLAMPMAPLVPLMLMALGFGIASRVAVVFMFAVIQIAVNAQAGTREVDQSLIDMARVYGATGSQTWRKVLLPAASPAIISGLRIGLGRAIDGMVIAELLLVASGLGLMLLESRASFQGGELFAMAIIVSVEATILLSLMQALERKRMAWA
jgi:NitT/TauT family transport system permease protein